MQAKRTIKIGSYFMEIIVESNHSVEYRVDVNGILLKGSTYLGADALKLQKGVPEGACGLVKLEGNGKHVPLYLTAKNAELVEKTVSELKAEASDPETDRIIKEKAEEEAVAQRDHYKQVKAFGDDEDDYLEDAGWLPQEQIDEFTAKEAECVTTFSDVGSIKVGVPGACGVCVTNGYGDGGTTVVIAKKPIPDLPVIGTFVTSVEGKQIGIFASNCGDTVAMTISGRYGIYNIPGTRCVVFNKWEDGR